MTEADLTRPNADLAALAAPSKGLLAQARWQHLLCRVLHIPLYAVCTGMMKYKARYVIENMAEVRRQFRELAREPGPILIASNHLTFIDSVLLIWAFGSNFWYLSHFDRFSWNLPAGDFFKKKLLYRFIALISKCVFIHRDGSKEHKDSVLTLCLHLLRAGEVVTIFPEGKRSRTGRFDPDKLTYGVAKLVTQLGRCRVLCVYVRGDRQDSFSNYPAPGSRFRISMQPLDMVARGKSRESYQEIVDKVGTTIKALEDRYFA